jgi:hypothetical protein
MAVDTRNKRFSLIGLGLPAPRILPGPSGAITAADRAMLLFLYYSALAAPPTYAPRVGTITGPDSTGAITGPDSQTAATGPGLAVTIIGPDGQMTVTGPGRTAAIT